MKYDLEFKLARVIEYSNNQHVYCPEGVDRKNFMIHVREWTYTFNEKGIDGLKHKIIVNHGQQKKS